MTKKEYAKLKLKEELEKYLESGGSVQKLPAQKRPKSSTAMSRPTKTKYAKPSDISLKRQKYKPGLTKLQKRKKMLNELGESAFIAHHKARYMKRGLTSERATSNAYRLLKSTKNSKIKLKQQHKRIRQKLSDKLDKKT